MAGNTRMKAHQSGYLVEKTRKQSRPTWEGRPRDRQDQPKETRSAPKEEYAKSYGSVKFLDGVQGESGIFEDPGSVFTTMAPDMMGAAMTLTIHPTSFD